MKSHSFGEQARIIFEGAAREQAVFYREEQQGIRHCDAHGIHEDTLRNEE